MASLLRELQERVQITGLSEKALRDLGDGLQAQLQQVPDSPQLLGRAAWLEAQSFGAWGTLQTEVTPVIGPSNPLSPGLSIWFEQDRACAAVT